MSKNNEQVETLVTSKLVMKSRLRLTDHLPDCTARVWKNGKQEKQMAHPSFVYCAKWVDKRKVITGLSSLAIIISFLKLIDTGYLR